MASIASSSVMICQTPYRAGYRPPSSAYEMRCYCVGYTQRKERRLSISVPRVEQRLAGARDSEGGDDGRGHRHRAARPASRRRGDFVNARTRAPEPALNLERIVQAAVHVAETEGLGAVSMSRVAAELGAAAMSLYRYVAAKDELLRAHGGRGLRNSPRPHRGPDEGWRAGLSRWAWAMPAAVSRHPWTLHIPMSGLPVRPHEVAWFEEALSCLRDTGLAEAEGIGDPAGERLRQECRHPGR